MKRFSLFGLVVQIDDAILGAADAVVAWCWNYLEIRRVVILRLILMVGVACKLIEYKLKSEAVGWVVFYLFCISIWVFAVELIGAREVRARNACCAMTRENGVSRAWRTFLILDMCTIFFSFKGWNLIELLDDAESVCFYASVVLFAAYEPEDPPMRKALFGLSVPQT